MGAVVPDMSMSLDGFVTGPSPRVGVPLGDGGQRLHDWMFRGRADPGKASGGGQAAEVDGAVAQESFATTGAVLMARADPARSGLCAGGPAQAGQRACRGGHVQPDRSRPVAALPGRNSRAGPGVAACSSRSWRGLPPAWPARPSSTSRSCAAPRAALPADIARVHVDVSIHARPIRNEYRSRQARAASQPAGRVPCRRPSKHPSRRRCSRWER